MGGLILPRPRGNLPIYDLRFTTAADFPNLLRENPDWRPEWPVFACKWRMDAPYPDVQHVLPIRHEAYVAYLRGDRSVVRALTDDLLDAHERVVRELRSPN